MNQPTQPEPAEITRQRLNVAAYEAHVAGKPVEYRDPVTRKWIGLESPAWLDNVAYRPKPFVLGRTVNGHTLPAGREWHRQDFTEEDLAGGWRPGMLNEARSKGDEAYHEFDKQWLSYPDKDESWDSICRQSSAKTRTRRAIITAPEVRAWTDDEMLGKHIRHKQSGRKYVIYGASEGRAYFHCGFATGAEILRDFTTLSGQPCGVEVGK